MLQVATRRIMLVSAALLYVFAISLNIITINIQKASADALIAYGGSDVSGVVEEEISLTGISVSGSDPTIPMVLDISDTNGILYMTDTTGLSFDGSDRGSRLSFSGSVTDLNNALATLKYRTLTSGTWTLTATLLGAGVVYFPGNGHLYEVVDNGSAISWDDAAPLAAARTLNGATGYLATVTEQAENDYLLGKLSGDGWFGASDATIEGDWQWVAGPETGTSFWAGLGDGAPVSSLFSNWADGEPNDAGGEDCAQFYSDGSGWNDLPCDGAFFSNYIVEYGGPSDIPTAPESIDFDVTVAEPTSATVPISSCLDLIDVYDNGADNRYDTLNVTADIDCDGESLSPMFDQTDPDFGIVGFRGTFNGNNHTISNVVMSNSVQSDFGLFSVANDATFQDVTISGSFEGDACTGSLVGRAINSSFQNITVGADVTGTNGTGGVVGCIEGSGDAESTLANSSTTSTVTGSDRVGGLVGTADLEDESVFGLTGNEFSGTLNSSGWAVGGILGSTEQSETAQFNVSANTASEINIPSANTVGGTIGYVYLEENSGINFNENHVTGLIYGDDTVGGFIGELTNDGDIDNSVVTNVSNNSAVTSGDGDNVGGIIGYASYSKLSNVSSSGDITGADDETGGLVGEAYNLEITESFSTSTILGYDSLVGGLVGRNSETTIQRSYSTGDVSGEDRVGGLVGANGGYIIDSYARGNISATDGEVGGLAGRCGRDITRSYATGEVSGSYDVGGLLGYSDGCDVIDSFWDVDTSLQATSSGDETGKSTTEMKEKDTFTDTATLGLDTAWDFSTVWAINTLVNDNYPCLQWQDENCEINTDNDGISKEEEAAAPNGGDANNDGTIDSVQNFVSSFVNPITSKYTVVETDAVCDLNAVSAEAESNKAAQDSGYAYSTGLVNFTADCGTPGYTTTVRLIFYDKLSNGLVLRKFNPATNAYFTISNATVTDSVIGGRPALVVTYQIVDGGELDTDGVVNGVIVDPVGLASLAVGVPNTGFQR